MERRTPTETVAANVRAALDSSSETPLSLAAATDMHISDLESRLNGTTPFTAPELVCVGGFLHSPIATLMKGVAA